MMRRIAPVVAPYVAWWFCQPWMRALTRLSLKCLSNTTRRKGLLYLSNMGLNEEALLLAKLSPSISECDRLLRTRFEEISRVLIDKAVPFSPVIKKPVVLQSSFNECVLLTLHNALTHDKAGYAIRSQMIVQALQKLRLNITVLTRPGYPDDMHGNKSPLADKSYLPETTAFMEDEDDEDLPLSAAYFMMSRDLDKSEIDGVIYHHLPESSYGAINCLSDSLYIEHYSKQLVIQALKQNVTVIHAASNYLNGLAAIRAAGTLNIKSVYEMRGLWYLSATTKYPFLKGAPITEYKQLMEQQTAREADAVIVISEALKQYITTEWNIDHNKVTVIPNGVDTNLFSPVEQNTALKAKLALDDRFIIGFAGSLTAYEGIDVLIESVIRLLNQGEKIALVIVGEGYAKKALMRLIPSQHERYIRFIGHVPFEQINTYYAIFDICAYPRKNLFGQTLVPPLKILEAMALAKPVITSRLACLKEMVIDGETGLLCSPDDIEALIDKIQHLCEDAELREQLGKKARQWVVKNRSWEVLGPRFFEIYKQLYSQYSTHSVSKETPVTS